MKLAMAYLVTFTIFVVIDLVWLGFVAKDFYRMSIGHLMGGGFNVSAAVAFYFIFIAGLVFFAVNPALEAGDWQRAAYLGAAFGFFAYATYDLTNLATLKDWPLSLALADLAWGTSLSGIAAALGCAVGARF